ncbi:hypothetical protein J6590_062731 [Homalodisca vitripennis]|nr:hypothetical protein J6590_094052 [Homalodisca vitripennis]KAG8300992.1 hypothetical protein J6590_062731 [Homalodisca vitripennis]
MDDSVTADVIPTEQNTRLRVMFRRDMATYETKRSSVKLSSDCDVTFFVTFEMQPLDREALLRWRAPDKIINQSHEQNLRLFSAYWPTGQDIPSKVTT